MDTSDQQATPPDGEPAPDPSAETTEQPGGPRRLLRSRQDRVLGGVCGGLGRYFGIDPVIFRIAAIALVLAAGTGILLYLAALLLIPEGEGEAGAPAGNRSWVVVAGVALLLLSPLLLPPVLIAGAALLPIAALLAAGLATWWLVSGQGASDGARQVLARSALGVAVLAGCALLALAGAWAAGVGGATVAGALALGAGAGLAIGAFTGRARRLVLPALAVAIPAAFVAAAGVDLRGGVGERVVKPAAAGELAPRYQLGMGQLVIDLRDSRLPPGDTRLALQVGVGRTLVLVPPRLCVASRSRVGLGAVELFEREDAGADVDSDDPGRAPAATPRLVLDARVGVGAVQVGLEDPDEHKFGDSRKGREWRDGWGERDADRQEAIAASACAAGGRVAPAA